MKIFTKMLMAICLMLLLSSALIAQNNTIKGIVVNGENGKILKGANVRIHGTTVSYITNENGEFFFSNIDKGEYIIKASYMGYVTERKKINITEGVVNISFKLFKTNLLLDEVTITGTGSHYRLKNTPIQTELITKKTIENLALNDFENVLTTISPSFDISPSAGMGSFSHINGLSSKYISFMVDGRKLTGDISGNIDLQRINPDNIERVEIIKGASSSLYGSDAIGGVINIITKKQKNHINVTENTLLGTNTLSQNVSLGLKNKYLSSTTSYNYTKDKDYTLEPEGLDKYFVYGKNTNNIFQDFEIKPNKNWKIHLGGNYYKKNLLTPKEKPKASYDYHYKGLTYYADAKYIFNKKNYIMLSFNKDDYKQEKSYFTGKEELLKHQKATTVNLKTIYKFNKQNTFMGGLEYIKDELETSNEKIPTGNKDAYTLAIFGQDIYKPLTNLSIVAGFRGIKHKTFGTDLTPKISAMYKLGEFNIRGTYSQGFKTPSLQELYYEYESSRSISVGNTDLKPEKSKYYNLSVEFVKSWLNASISIYRNNISDMINKKIIADPSNIDLVGNHDLSKDVYLYSNISKARAQGIDFSFNSYIGHGFTLGGGYSYVDSRDLETERNINRTAHNYANARIAYDLNLNKYSLNITLSSKYQGGKFYGYESKGKYILGKTSDYNIFRLSTQHRFYSFKKVVINLTAGIDNIFNYIDSNPVEKRSKRSTYYYYGSLNPGRTYFVGLKFTFSK